MAAPAAKSNDADPEQEPIADQPENEVRGFTMATFNIWCPYYNHSGNGYEYKDKNRWKKRHRELLRVLSSDPSEDSKEEESLPPMNCDLYCLQEFWIGNEPFTRMYRSHLESRGYELHLLKRSSPRKPDGLAMAFNKNTFKMHHKNHCKYTMNSRVALIMELEHIASGCRLQIGSTHLTFPSEPCDVQIRADQVKEFLAAMEKHEALAAENSENATSALIMCGDYNCEIGENECTETLKKGYMSTFHTIHPTAVKEPVVSHFNHEQKSLLVDHIFLKQNKGAKYTLEPTESYLYPKDIATDKWYPAWTLSDHRPIVTTFSIQKEDTEDLDAIEQFLVEAVEK